MDRSDVIVLVSETMVKDAYGIARSVPSRSTVFARVGSVTLQEATDAGQHQLRRAMRFTILAAEYADQPFVIWRGEKYSVYRTYRATGDTLELYAEVKGGV